MTASPHNQIEDYINNELSPEEKHVFEQAMQQDQALKDEVHKSIELKLRLDTLRLKLKTKAIGRQYLKERKQIRYFNWLTIAAALTLLLSTVYFYLELQDASSFKTEHILSNNQDGNHNQATQDSLELNGNTADLSQYDSTSSEARSEISPSAISWIRSNMVLIELNLLRDADEDTMNHSKLLNTSKNLIAANQYKRALEQLNKFEPGHEDATVLFLKAYCYFQIKEYKKASILFRGLMNELSYKYEAEWNYLLCLFLMNEQQKSNDLLLNILSDIDHPYFNQAKELELRLE